MRSRLLLLVLFTCSLVATGVSPVLSAPHDLTIRATSPVAETLAMRALEAVGPVSEVASTTLGHSSGHKAAPRSHCDVHCPQMRVGVSDATVGRDWRIANLAAPASAPMKGVEPPVPVGPPRS